MIHILDAHCPGCGGPLGAALNWACAVCWALATETVQEYYRRATGCRLTIESATCPHRSESLQELPKERPKERPIESDKRGKCKCGFPVKCSACYVDMTP